MISFSKLGTRSRLGNHLFQYAFLRSTAQRLGTQFYCPPWSGDEIFELNDSAERLSSPPTTKHLYTEPYANPGFNASATSITDETEIEGFFQSYKYLDERQIKKWYSFKEEKIKRVREKYKNINFKESVGLHIRLGDFVTNYSDLYYVAKSKYYENSIKITPRNKNIIVFSDDIPVAQKILQSISVKAIYIEGNEAHEDLYLQAQCRDFICSPSTYSWWGGWLNMSPDKVIVAPKEGPFRPGAPISNHDFWPPEWSRVKALRTYLDSHDAYLKRKLIERGLKKAIRIATKPLRK